MDVTPAAVQLRACGMLPVARGWIVHRCSSHVPLGVLLTKCGLSGFASKVQIFAWAKAHPSVSCHDFFCWLKFLQGKRCLDMSKMPIAIQPKVSGRIRLFAPPALVGDLTLPWSVITSWALHCEICSLHGKVGTGTVLEKHWSIKASKRQKSSKRQSVSKRQIVKASHSAKVVYWAPISRY